MVSVNDFVVYGDYLVNKIQGGGTMPEGDTLNSVMHQSQLLPYTQDYETFALTTAQGGGVVSNYLQTFLVTNYVQQVLPSNPIMPYPADFQYVSSVGTYYNGTQNDATLVDNVQWRQMFRPNSLTYPTLRFPKYQQIGAGIIFAPNNVGTVYLDYFKVPTPPKWGYNVVDDSPVYDPTTSVNFEWDAFNTNRVMAVFLQLIGVNLQDVNLQQFSQMFTAETKTIL